MAYKYIIRKRQIGDVLWIEPVIRALSGRYRKVYVYTKYNELFENYPLKNVVFKTKLNLLEKLGALAERILGTTFLFINLDMSYEKKPHLHLLHAYQQKAGLPATYEYPKLYLSRKEGNEEFYPSKKYIILHLESFTDKNYRKVFGINWEIILKHCKNLGYTFVLIGKNPEKIAGAEIIQTNLRELIALINKCDLFIGIDSGPSHIATALGKPALIFFGAVNPLLRHFPEKFKGYFLQQPCEFSGCYHEVISKSGQTCRLVGDSGIPKCSLHSNAYLLNAINNLIFEITHDSKVYQ